jgi:hypothetical protein
MGCVGAEATSWPIVGRDGELAAVQFAILDPACGGVVLAGTQGAGRTSLARETEFRALAAGRATIWATGTRAASALPFGALAHLLPDDPSGLDFDRPVELLSRIEAVLGEPGPAGPPMVVVDDAHLLDGLSAAFLHQAVLRRRVAVALTVRSDAPAPDPVVALWKDRLVDRIAVGPLGRDDTAELLERALGAPLDPASFERLWDLTRGTPLFLREIVRAARADGSLARRRGVWQWDGRLGDGGRLAGLVEDRLAAEDPRCRPVLELVACGEPLAVWLAEHLAGPEGLDAAERAGLLESVAGTGEPAVRFAHPVHREVLRAALPLGRRRELCERLASALIDRGDAARPAGLVRVALWQLEAGTPAWGRGVSFAAAAHQALRDGDPRVAERLARAAFDAEPTSALVVLAEALEKQGRHVEAIRLLDRVEVRGDGAALTLARSANGYWAGDRAAAVLAEDDASGGEVPATEAWVLFFESRLADCVEVARAVLGRPDATMRARVWAATAGAAALGLCGRSGEARAVADAGSQAAESGPEDPWARPEILWARVILLVTGGRLAAARDLVEQAGHPGTGASAQFVGMGLGFHGLVARLQGHHDTAAASLGHAVDLLERADMYRFARLWLAELGAALALGGDAAGARAAYDAARAQDSETNPVFDPWIALDGAWVCAAEGRPVDAVDRALAAAEQARELGQRAFEVVAAFDVARLGRPDLVVDRLGALVPLVDGDFAPACRRAALALADRDPAGLTDCSRLFEELGHDLLAAEVATAAYARLRSGSGPGTAAHAAERARRLRDRCPGAVTPLLALAPAPDQRLVTPGEQEVAGLLEWAVRTVEQADAGG